MAQYNVNGTIVELPAVGDGLKVSEVRTAYLSKAGRFGISAYAIDKHGHKYSISASRLKDSEVAPAPVAPVAPTAKTPILPMVAPTAPANAAFLDF
jgi:hypothetical protein